MFSTTIESIIWGGEKNIPPMLKRKLQRNDDLEPIDPPQKFFESVPDEPYEEQRDDEATERFPDALFEEQRERSEDYPQGGMLEPYDIEGDR